MTLSIIFLSILMMPRVLPSPRFLFTTALLKICLPSKFCSSSVCKNTWFDGMVWECYEVGERSAGQ